MKVIDLLNKIVNGEEVPKEIIYKGKTYYAEFNSISGKNYYCDDKDNLLLDSINNVIQLNDEIEEDKKIEKIKPTNYCIDTLREKINEIIDKLNEGE